MIIETPIRNALNRAKSKNVSFKRPSEIKNNKESLEDDDEGDGDANDESTTLTQKPLKDRIADVRKLLQCYFVTSWSGTLYKHCMIAASLVSLVLYIVETYEDHIFVTFERILSVLFMWDWCLSVFLTSMPLKFVMR
jgi:hypothetical protein